MKRTQTSTYYLAALVALLTFAVYFRSLHNGFVNWDDADYVLNNPHIRSFDLRFLKWAFLEFYASNWHPLTWISHALDYAVWGLNPFGHHFTNNVLHAANAFLVVLLAIRLLDAHAKRRGGPALGERNVLVAGLVTGLLFGMHPLHVESVAWVAERKDVLCAFFFLLALLGYVKYAGDTDENEPLLKRFSRRSYLLVLIAFLCALMSKPMAVSLPFVLLILDWFPLERIRSLMTLRRALVEKIPFFALSLVSSVLTFLAQGAGGSLVSTQYVSLSERLLVAARSLIAYLWQTVAPLNLIPYYPYPKGISLLSPDYLFAVFLVVVITAVCLVVSKKQKLWLSVWGYYVVTLIPVLGIVQVGTQAMADRYMYLPGLGPFLLIALGAAWGVDRMSGLIRSKKLLGAVCLCAAMLTFFPMAYLTYRQIGIWKNGLSLWSYVIEKEPEASIAYTNRGSVLEKMGKFDKAIQDFDRAIRLFPGDYLAYVNRGAVFDKMGLPDRAIENYDRAVALDPRGVPAYYNRGMTFAEIGKLDKAIDDFEHARTLNPDDYRIHNNLGILYDRKGLYEKSVLSFDRTITLNPGYPMAYHNRGLVLFYMGRYGQALEDFNRAILLKANDGSAYYNRGNTYLRLGRKESAISDFRMGCTLGNQQACSALQGLLLNRSIPKPSP
jgi:tetratricopeptide (TPR) repeat protein